MHNIGGHYDPTTGIYTTPIDGTYEFIIRLRAYNDAIAEAFLIVDGVQVSLLPPAKLQKGNDFTDVCLFTGGMPHARGIPPWTQTLLGGRSPLEGTWTRQEVTSCPPRSTNV